MKRRKKYAAIGIYYIHAGRSAIIIHVDIVSRSPARKHFFSASCRNFVVFRKWQICRKQEQFNELEQFIKVQFLTQSLTHHLFSFLCSNGSGSREATTIKHTRGRAETSGPGQENAPMPPTMNDPYVDLMAIVLGHEKGSSHTNYEKVIIKSEGDDSNPSLADLMDVKLR